MSAVPKPQHRKQRKRFHARRDPAYMAWIHTQPCLLRRNIFHTCWGQIEGCHVQSRGAGGNDHGNLVAMCSAGHRLQHLWGTSTFERHWEVNLTIEAARLWTLYQDAVPPFQET